MKQNRQVVRRAIHLCLGILLLFLFVGRAEQGFAKKTDKNQYSKGGIIRGDVSRKRISLVFTAADMADGAPSIIRTLKEKKVEGGFFLTGRFYEKFPEVVRQLVRDGHYVGSHSYGHLLYAPWDKPDSVLITQNEFDADMQQSYRLMKTFGISQKAHRYFIPPYEHYNGTISDWAKQLGLQVINFTAGPGSNADYTIPSMKNYRSSETIYENILNYEQQHSLNGHFLLIHLGTHSDRKDKFYLWLPRLIDELRSRGYEFVGVRKMIEN